MNVDATTPVGELAAEIPNAIRVFEKWNIDYCCGGKRTLKDVCETSAIPLDEVLSSLSGSFESETEEAVNWNDVPMTDLIEYIVSTHHVYTRETVETLLVLMKKVLAVHGANHPELQELAPLVSQLNEDLMPHMAKEEQVLFPVVRRMESGVLPVSPDLTMPIRVMMLEHDAAAELLARVREVTADYRLPEEACFSYRQLYGRLADLEKDLHRHIHLENNILFPRALELSR